MIVSETEAKTKFCPFTREIVSAPSDAPTANGSMDFTCVGSRCMAWRQELDGAGVAIGKGRCGMAGP